MKIGLISPNQANQFKKVIFLKNPRESLIIPLEYTINIMNLFIFSRIY